MSTITILCPYHGIPEDLVLPDTQETGEFSFQGEVMCTDLQGPDYRALLYVEVRGTEASLVRISRSPRIDNRYFE
jgi:hypothetical protein